MEFNGSLLYRKSQDTYYLKLSPSVIREKFKPIKKPNILNQSETPILVKCSECSKIHSYKPDTSKKGRKRKKCSCGCFFSCDRAFETTIKKLRSNSPDLKLENKIVLFLRIKKKSCTLKEIQQYCEINYSSLYRKLAKMTNNNTIQKFRGKENLYSLEKIIKPVYDLSKIKWPKRIDAHNISFKYQIINKPSNWQLLRENYSLWNMKSWKGDGRIIEKDNHFIKITPSNIIFQFKKSFRYIASSTHKALEFVKNQFAPSLMFLKEINFSISEEPEIIGLEFALPDIPLSKYSPGIKIKNNNKILLKKDNSPDEIDHLEVNDLEIAQSILDVVKNSKNLRENLFIQKKSIEKLQKELIQTIQTNSLNSEVVQLQKFAFDSKNAQIDARLKQHDDQILTLQDEILATNDKLAGFANNLSEISGNVIQLTDSIAEKGGVF
jgi:hypothetical protein